MYIWKTRSTNSEMINAALRLSTPTEQNLTGKEDFAAYSALEDHTWPPWLHSQMILSPLQLHNHQDSANCADDNDKRPEEFANADPDVRPIRKRNDVDQCQESDSHSNTSVNVPFREEEEKILPRD
jgi:hypothetical protein